MPLDTLSRFVLLPELKLTYLKAARNRQSGLYFVEKRDQSQPEVCPKCASLSRSVYDHRFVRVKDEPIRGHDVILMVRKRRLWCKPCQKPFTEYIPGIRKGKRHTERYLASIVWACDKFSDLKSVKRAFACSSHFLYEAYYNHLERKRLERLNYPWPRIVGIDEHAFRRNPSTGRTEFASMIVDYENKRVRELVEGKTTAELKAALSSIPGPENVRYAVTDLCDPFKNYVKQNLPNATLVADKFHVLRLLTPSLLRRRQEISGDRADLRAKKLLLMSAHRLKYSERLAIHRFLERYPEMHELYQWKERLHGFYRIRGYDRAVTALTAITDAMAASLLPEIKTLRRTLMKWREEILAYFKTGLTNARTEGFNNKAKVVKRRGYGYKSFRNYRLKVLTACA